MEYVARKRRVVKVSRIRCAVLVTVGAVVALAFGFLIGWFSARHALVSNTAPVTTTTEKLSSENGHQDIKEQFLKLLDAEEIKANLKSLSAVPRVAGLRAAEGWAARLRELWLQQGADDAGINSYNVLLSYPGNSTRPNRVQLVGADGAVEQEYTGAGERQHAGPRSPQLHAAGQLLPPYVAYSRPGTVRGAAVYANLGRAEDLDYLTVNCSISLRGKVLLVRAGGSFPAAVAAAAARRGAGAVLLFADPMKEAPDGPEDVYPAGRGLPADAVWRTSARALLGDPLTPYYPATDFSQRPPESAWASEQTPLPVHVISYEAARALLDATRGPGRPLPAAWRDWEQDAPDAEDLHEFTYVINDVMKDGKQVVVEVNNQLAVRPIHNVCAMIRGHQEPDRLVIVGNHRDSWVYGAVDPGGSTAILMELVRVLAHLKNHGWRPRRTLLFCSWDAEEFAIIGSTEWVEENLRVLQHRAVAYLNIDTVVAGLNFITADGSPLLHDLMLHVATQTQHPEFNTLFDAWGNHSAEEGYGEPRVDLVQPVSDSAPFYLTAGVPTAQICYKERPDTYYSTYHTGYDTFEYVTQAVDPTFEYHVMMTGYYGQMALQLAGRPLLPLSALTYANTLKETFNRAVNWLVRADDTVYLLRGEGAPLLGQLRLCLHNFTQAATTFHAQLNGADLDSPLLLRGFNDKLMTLEQAFLDDQWRAGDKSNFRHIFRTLEPLSECNLLYGFPVLNRALCHPQVRPHLANRVMPPASHAILQGALAVYCHAFNAASRMLLI